MSAARDTQRTRGGHEITKPRNAGRCVSCFRVFVARPLVAIVWVASAVAVLAQAPAQPQLPKGQMHELGRPTQSDDALPAFNFDDYFPGRWTFEWDVPEGALGPAGRITGTTTYKPVDGRFYEVTTEATGPAGKFTVRELLAYHR